MKKNDLQCVEKQICRVFKQIIIHFPYRNYIYATFFDNIFTYCKKS